MKKKSAWKRYCQDIKIFLNELRKNPANVGAIWPSSMKLGMAMAQEVPQPSPQGLVLELGAGTGVITSALLQSGLPASQLILIERSRRMVQHLKEQYPNVTILEGDAAEVPNLLGDKFQKIEAVISSLPLLSLPKTLSKAIIDALTALPNGTPFVQFSYRAHADHPSDNHPGLSLVKRKKVWLNVPPAWVSTYKIVHHDKQPIH